MTNPANPREPEFRKGVRVATFAGAARRPIADGWQITISDGHSGYGAYAHMTEYPEEGAVLVAAAPAQGEQVGWVDEFGNVFPIDAWKPAKSTYHDAHKKVWEPVYRASSTPAQGEPMTEEVTCLRCGFVNYVRDGEAPSQTHYRVMKERTAHLAFGAAPVQADLQALRADAERMDWIEATINGKGAVWFLPCGEDLRFVQVRHPSWPEVTNYPTVEGLRAAIDAAKKGQS
jgi:hypothetical protein